MIDFKKYELKEIAQVYSLLFGQYLGFLCTKPLKEESLYREINFKNLVQLRMQLIDVEILETTIDEIEKRVLPEIADYLPASSEKMEAIYKEYIDRFSLVTN